MLKSLPKALGVIGVSAGIFAFAYGVIAAINGKNPVGTDLLLAVGGGAMFITSILHILTFSRIDKIDNSMTNLMGAFENHLKEDHS